MPKQAERPVYSYRLSIIHFWSLIFLYIWAGPHHQIRQHRLIDQRFDHIAIMAAPVPSNAAAHQPGFGRKAQRLFLIMDGVNQRGHAKQAAIRIAGIGLHRHDLHATEVPARLSGHIQRHRHAIGLGIIIVDVQQDIFHATPIRKTDYRPASIPTPFLCSCPVQGFTHDSGVRRIRGAFRQPMNGVTGGA